MAKVRKKKRAPQGPRDKKIGCQHLSFDIIGPSALLRVSNIQHGILSSVLMTAVNEAQLFALIKFFTQAHNRLVYVNKTRKEGK